MVCTSSHGGQVQSVFTLSVSELLDPAFRVMDDLGHYGRLPAFTAGPHRVWGLTGLAVDAIFKKVIVPWLRAERASARSGEVVDRESYPREGPLISFL